MKAVRVHQFGPPSVMRLDEVPEPKPGPGQVLVEIKASGVNPVDTYLRSGSYGRLPKLPYIPGNDGAGIVRALGEGVRGVATGDRVYMTGTAGERLTGSYAELAVCTVSQVKELPPMVSFSQGAAMGVPYTTAYRAIFYKAHAMPGETVLVHGASGGVGIAAVQLGVAHGLRIMGTAGTDRGRKLVQEQGAHHVFDHTAPDYLEKILSVTDGRGVDVILENLANVNLANDLNLLATRGRVVVIGSRGTIEIDPRAAMVRDATIAGLVLWNASETELASIHAALVAGLVHGTVRPIVGRELPLAQAPQAHEAVMAPGAYGKIVLIP
jgi:NADPH2:quinone reductase